MTFDSHIPTRVLFGAGALTRLSDAPMPGRKALIVTSKGTVKRGLCQKAVDLLQKRGIPCEIFAKVLPNPSLQHVDEAAALARSENCDFILGLGGGSSLDSAKGTALAAANGGSLWDYCSRGTGKGLPLKQRPLPIVTVSTTASTGSEINAVFVISNIPAGEKIGLRFPPHTFPVLSIVDPELTLTIPSEATAYQGCDILFHAVEGYHSIKATPLSRMYSLQAIKLASGALPKAVKNGLDLSARTDLAVANLLSGMVLASSSMTSAHSLEHGLSALHPNLPHGAGLVMLCPAFYGFWAHQGAPRLAELAEAFGANTRALPPKEGALLLVKAFRDLFSACEISHIKMSDYGITRAELPKALSAALASAGGAFNLDPRPLSSNEALVILNEAWA